MTAPRVIATDLDGTLLGPRGALTDRTRTALRAARAQGVALVAVTARPPRVFQEWTALAAALDTAICANGAMVYDPAGQAVTASRTLPAETAAMAAKALRTALPSLRFAVETGFEVVAETGYAKVDSVGDRRTFRDSLTEALAAAPQVVKLLAHVDGGEADLLLAAARGLDLAGVDLSHSGGAGLLEIGPAGVTKAGTLAAWCAGRGIGPEAVVAFGDAPNDVPMLAWAGRSFAVANAHPEAAAAATDRCGSNLDDGVAAAVEALLR
ncbi:Cof-type HAD-IIB family hydrolase [Glycomyces sp. A-F 0318]|uniref:HAD family hydrolase n=1 Tax=Glycomyces amatae TaxID=2881355 RepID=UPI001E3FBD31|nr:HAD family hydrolase [Glycomyces amatae]MCD0442768.1 Cof-type HAD-IIB family hydrolase [Glycomyces amatae]